MGRAGASVGSVDNRPSGDSMYRGKPIVRRLTAILSTLFLVVAGMVATTAAASASTFATHCDGWTIASANHVGGYGAVQLLRNYCHADGTDYTNWEGRGFLYAKHSITTNLSVDLQLDHHVARHCGLNGLDGGNGAFCTTTPINLLITDRRERYAAANLIRCDSPERCVWLAGGTTAIATI